MESFDRLFDFVFGTQTVAPKLTKKQVKWVKTVVDSHKLGELGNFLVADPDYLAGETKELKYVPFDYAASVLAEAQWSDEYTQEQFDTVKSYLSDVESRFNAAKKQQHKEQKLIEAPKQEEPKQIEAPIRLKYEAVAVKNFKGGDNPDATYLTFKKGAEIQVLGRNTRPEWKDWVYGSIGSREGLLPLSSIVKKEDYTPDKRLRYDAVAVKDFKGGENPDAAYLTFKKGAKVHVLGRNTRPEWKDWVYGSIGSREGLLPLECIKEEEEAPKHEDPNVITQANAFNKDEPLYDAIAIKNLKRSDPQYLSFKKGDTVVVYWEGDGYGYGTVGDSEQYAYFPLTSVKKKDEASAEDPTPATEEAPIAEAPNLRNPSPASIGNSELAPQTGSTTNNTVQAPETYEYRPLKKNLMDHYKDKTGNELQYLVNGNHVEPEVLNDVKASMRVKLIAEAKEARDRQMADDNKTLETIADDEAIDPEKLMGLRNSRRKLHKVQEDVFETPNRFDGFTTGVDEWSENPLERNIQVADRYYADGMPSLNEVMYDTARRNNQGAKALKRIGTKTAKQQMSQMHDYSVYNMANAAPTMTSQKINQPLRRCDDNVNNSAVGPDDYLRALFRR